MTTVSKIYTPAKILQGPVEIYIGITPPPSAVPPVQGTDTIVLDSSGQPTIGSTGQIASVALGNSGGTGYSVGDTLTLTQSGGSFGMVRVASVSGGVVVTLILLRGGQGYSAAANLPTTGGGGTGCTITISTITAGFHLGLCEGPASFTHTPKFELINADQFAAPVDAAFSSNTGEIDFTVKELLLVNLAKYFAGVASATYFNLGAGSTNPATDFLQIGGQKSAASIAIPLLLVSPRRDVPNKFVYMMAYRAYIKSQIQLPVQRGKETMIKMKWGMLLDTTRVLSDMASQVVRQT